MKKISKNKKLVNDCGLGARLVALEKNPHGFAAVHKVHKSKKTYSRKNSKNI